MISSNYFDDIQLRLNGWIYYHFNSVSTKYLKNYLNWFAFLEILKKKQNKTNKVWDYILYDGNTFDRFKGTENNYQEFVKELG
jgi:hypothetical protein